MTNSSGLLALPLFHYRERYGRPTSDLQRLYPDDPCCFHIAPGRFLSLPVLRRSSGHRRCRCLFVFVVVVVVVDLVVYTFLCFWLLLFVA